MKSYEIWLKGGGNLNGVMKDEDATELHKEIKKQRGIFVYVDEDNDEVSLIIDQIAVFACRDDPKSTKKKAGFVIE